MSKETQLYEIGLLLHPEMTEEGAAAALGTVRSYIEKESAVIERTTDQKMRRLGYPINKMTQAYFAAFQFTAAPEAIASVKKSVDADTLVMRHLIMKCKREASRSIIQQPAQPSVATKTVSPRPKEPAAPKVDEKEIDKQLDEILGE